MNVRQLLRQLGPEHRDLARQARSWPARGFHALAFVIDMLARRSPFGLVRYGDGEMMAIRGRALRVARDEQRVSPQLASALRAGLEKPAPGVVVGIPCPACWPEDHVAARRLVPAGHQLVPATALQNTAHILATQTILGVLRAQKDRQVAWVGAASHNLSQIEGLLGRMVMHVPVPERDAFDAAIQQFDEISDGLARAAVVFLSCGPASRHGVNVLRAASPHVTAIDIGTLFDPMTRGIRHSYHREDGRLVCPACSGPVHRKRWNALHERLDS